MAVHGEGERASKVDISIESMRTLRANAFSCASSVAVSSPSSSSGMNDTPLLMGRLARLPGLPARGLLVADRGECGGEPSLPRSLSGLAAICTLRAADLDVSRGDLGCCWGDAGGRGEEDRPVVLATGGLATLTLALKPHPRDFEAGPPLRLGRDWSSLT